MINILTRDEIVAQLVEIYNNFESETRGKLMDKEQAIHYHKTLLDRGNIIVYEEDGQIRGYVEIWKITFEQFGRIICHEKFCAPLENIVDGNIAYVANTFIFPEHRRGLVYKYLRNEFFRNSYKCQYYVGSALRKKTQPIKVFKREALMRKLYREGKD